MRRLARAVFFICRTGCLPARRAARSLKRRECIETIDTIADVVEMYGMRTRFHSQQVEPMVLGGATTLVSDCRYAPIVLS